MKRFSKSVATSIIAVLTVLSTSGYASAPDAALLAARIDHYIDLGWQKAAIQSAAVADDGTFLRRAYLDLVGRIPTVAEARAFLGDKSPDKRSVLVNRLMASGAHDRPLATFWRRTWLPQADTAGFAPLAEGFEEWIADRLHRNTPYDRLVLELLTVKASGKPVARATSSEVPTPLSFLTASERKPENLAANATRAFLGINLDCAHCHDHPFARWTRQQFWETAAFFVRPSSINGIEPARFELKIPETEKIVSARFLTDAPLDWPAEVQPDTGREILARWIIAAENPFFARNAVNRLWAQFMGIGLVEPLDDLSGQNPPSHPELLDELSRALIASGFDLKYVTQAIVLSKPYQLSSTVPSESADSDPRLFSRAPVRGLTGEQLYTSLRIAAGLPIERYDLHTASELKQARDRFTAQFYTERPATAQRSIVQALTLMNGKLTSDLSGLEKNPLLAAVAESPFLDTRGKVNALYVAVLGHPPEDDEIYPLIEYVDRGGADHDLRKALADIFWALVNTSEFNTIH